MDKKEYREQIIEEYRTFWNTKYKELGKYIVENHYDFTPGMARYFTNKALDTFLEKYQDEA